VEFLVALCVFVLAAPAMLLCVLAVKLTSRGPAFYSQLRLGLNGRPFRIYKLRTMYHECELQSGPRWATANDRRVTPVGRLLRSTHLDELPQLWNVLRGEMSLVGPRPERPEFVPELARFIPLYRKRMLMRPGLTGLAQVQLSADTNLAIVRRKLAYDLYYVRKISPWLDMRVLCSTMLKVVGVPFLLLRIVFRLPSPAVVEENYLILCACSGQFSEFPLPGGAESSEVGTALPHLSFVGAPDGSSLNSSESDLVGGAT
jgi:lipopolysaccharide/colanic/teichoic acid biosynthesis glycosyltransferase